MCLASEKVAPIARVTEMGYVASLERILHGFLCIAWAASDAVLFCVEMRECAGIGHAFVSGSITLGIV